MTDNPFLKALLPTNHPRNTFYHNTFRRYFSAALHLAKLKMRNFLAKYGGIIIGSLYGLIMREFFGIQNNVEFVDLFSITFVWIVPFVIGITPIFFATKEQLASNRYCTSRPILTVFLFFVIAFWTGEEDMICIVIISIPFLIAAGFGGYVFANSLKGEEIKMGHFIRFLLSLC